MPRTKSPLYRLIYHSRNRLTGSASDQEKSVRDILSVARRKNALVGVTGALMFNSACFIQILEGKRDAVERIYERIRCDTRHGVVTLLSFESIAERAFGNWSMAYVGAVEAEKALHDGIAKESGYDPSKMSGESLFEFLHNLVLRDEYAHQSH
jgi:hypothetical protein